MSLVIIVIDTQIPTTCSFGIDSTDTFTIFVLVKFHFVTLYFPATPHTDKKFTSLRSKLQALPFLSYFFDLPVMIKDNLPLSLIPQSARRSHPSWGTKQILTTYVIEEILIPRLPDDGAAFLALTNADLWPGPGWNFVFGQASIEDHVGVWSMYRNGDPDKSKDDFKISLVRTLKTAAHEIGHMFSMLHCIKYKCFTPKSATL